MSKRKSKAYWIKYLIASKLEPLFVVESFVKLKQNVGIHKVNKTVPNVAVVLKLQQKIL